MTADEVLGLLAYRRGGHSQLNSNSTQVY